MDKYYVVLTNKRRWIVRHSHTGAATYAVQSHSDYARDERVKKTLLALDYPPFIRALASGKKFAAKRAD